MIKKTGLGKGLGAIFTETVADDSEQVIEINVNEIAPNQFQPRKVFDDEKLADLCDSIKQYGVLQPIVLRKIAEGYEIVAGERRWRATKMAGKTLIPAVVRDYSDAEMTEIALIENIQRQDLNAIEEAMAYKQLIEQFGLTQEEVAKKIGKSRSQVANTIRLLQLDQRVQDYVSRGTLTMGQVRPLLALGTPQMQYEAATRIVEDELSSRDAEEIIRRMTNKVKSKPVKNALKREVFLIAVEDKLKIILGTQVKIKAGKVKGKIEIEYYSPEDLERILEVFKVNETSTEHTKTTSLIV